MEKAENTPEEAKRISSVFDDERRTLYEASRSVSVSSVAALEVGKVETGPIGLALSGGGIRSATFCLGVLQALAARQRLASFDYLSTVSGGGYIGAWLSAWIKRKGLQEVQGRLPPSTSGSRASPFSQEASEITWLRRYSNYLAPRIGLFSLDSMTLVATWLRNVSLNLVVVLSCLGLLFLAPVYLLGPLAGTKAYSPAFGYAAAWVGLLFLSGIVFNLWHQGLPISRRRNWLISANGVAATVLLPGVLAAGTGALWLFLGEPSAEIRRFALTYVYVLLGILLLAWFLAEGAKGTFAGTLWRALAIHGAAAAVSLGIAAGTLSAFFSAWQRLGEVTGVALQLPLAISFGPPAVLAAFGIAGSVFTGLVGRVLFERSREWWSRLNAWFIVLGGGWLALCLLAFFALPTLQWLSERIGGWLALVGTGWIGTLLTVIFARRPETASTKVKLRVDLLLTIAASVFVIGLLIAVAATTSAGLIRSAGLATRPPVAQAKPSSVSFDFRSEGDRIDYEVSVERPSPAPYSAFVHAHALALDQVRSVAGVIPATSASGSALLLLVGVALLFGWRVDINRFSLHNMYKNRLVRCYLGASNQTNRNEQPFTGLDDGDDVALKDLRDSDGRIQRPFHIINTALNISQGSNLAWQERKAACFVLTPLYCGFSLAQTQGDEVRIPDALDADIPGYRRTAEYAARDREETGFTLGMAVATSGAAVSPNMGCATQPTLAFLLTLFNLRLGRWSPNPAGDKWRQPSPRFGLVCLLQELFGYSNERRSFLYLSDGGHFENLGLYELVRRRCKVIFVVDAAADPKRTFGDLANAVRKCRVDLGVEITFPDLDLLRGDGAMRAARAFVEGKILYDTNDKSATGTIVLIKPTLRREQDEPADILHYAAQNPPFPQQTTADQFFDESQFESYRRLGLFIGEQSLDKHQDLLPVVPTEPIGPPPASLGETPTFATRWIDALFFRRAAAGHELPPRGGSLSDFFLLGLIVSVLFLGVFALLDRLWLPQVASALCLSREACQPSVQSLLDGLRAPTGSLGGWVFWRTLLDNVFVIAYVGTLIMGFVVARQPTSPGRKSAGRRLAMVVPISLVLLMGVVDYIENFLTLGWQRMSASVPHAAEGIAAFTALKCQAATVCLIALILLARPIVSRIRERWSRPG